MQQGNSNNISRREALKAAATFMILPSGLARGYQANSKLNLGIIGLAGMGRVDAKTFADTWREHRRVVRRGFRDPREARGGASGARKYTDFRQMIEKEKLDGVNVAVPDHSHAYISVYAMKHGLHTYCQKPLCQSVHEARVMAKVAAETKLVTQMGTQSSAEARVLRTVEMIQAGQIGEVTEIHMTTDRPIWPQGYDRIAGEDPVPATLNWDLWLGTAATRPYQARWPEGHPVQAAREQAGARPGRHVSIIRSPGAAGWTSAAARWATSHRTP